jgi:predicted dehydrogenase
MKKPVTGLKGVVVGLGSIGNRHIQNLLAMGVHNLTVVRRSNSVNRQFTPDDRVHVCHSLSEALSAQPDFAIVCNPSSLHADTAAECLEAGVHVLVEKPLGRTMGASEKRLAALAGTSGRVCAMAYCMRYHPAYRMAREQIRGGGIGKCLYASSWFEGYLPDWHPWEDYRTSYAALPEQGGGALRTLDHEIDFLNWVLGPAVTSAGMSRNTGSIGIVADDVAHVVSEHPGNVTSRITVAFCRKPASRGFEFVGDSGTLSYLMESGQLLHVNRDGKATDLLQSTSSDVQQMYKDLVTDFLAVVAQEHTSCQLAHLRDGSAALRTIDQIDSEHSEVAT